MRVRITGGYPRYAVGTEHDAASRIPHGGYTDASSIYWQADGWVVNSDHAEEIPKPPLFEETILELAKSPSEGILSRPRDPQVAELEREVEELRKQVQQKEMALKELSTGPNFPSFWGGVRYPCPSSGRACDRGCRHTCARW